MACVEMLVTAPQMVSLPLMGLGQWLQAPTLKTVVEVSHVQCVARARPNLFLDLRAAHLGFCMTYYKGEVALLLTVIHILIRYHLLVIM